MSLCDASVTGLCDTDLTKYSSTRVHRDFDLVAARLLLLLLLVVVVKKSCPALCLCPHSIGQ